MSSGKKKITEWLEGKITSSYRRQISRSHVEHVTHITQLQRRTPVSRRGCSRWENTSLICLMAVNMRGYYSCGSNVHFICFCTRQRMRERLLPMKCEWTLWKLEAEERVAKLVQELWSIAGKGKGSRDEVNRGRAQQTTSQATPFRRENSWTNQDVFVQLIGECSALHRTTEESLFKEINDLLCCLLDTKDRVQNVVSCYGIGHCSSSSLQSECSEHKDTVRTSAFICVLVSQNWTAGKMSLWGTRWGKGEAYPLNKQREDKDVLLKFIMTQMFNKPSH